MELPINQIVCGDCLEVMKGWPDGCVHCVVTSPPYWGLRDYGIEPSVWDDGWRGCYGLEPTPELFVEHTVTIFREVRRVMRDDGALWLNLGDSYASGKGTCYNPGGGESSLGNATNPGKNKKANGVYPLDRGNISTLRESGLKPKDLVGIPWRVAFALQADGWYLRQDIIWHKPNPMPESVTDRCTKAHEYIFLLSKSARYYFDSKAIAEVAAKTGTPGHLQSGNGPGRFRNGEALSWDHCLGRNKRSVWTVPTAPFKEAHFATFPPELVRPCILAGTSQKGCCPQCGAPWERVMSKTRTATRPGANTKIKVPGGWDVAPGSHGTIHREGRTEATYRDTSEVGNRDPGRHVTESTTISWQPTCECGVSNGEYLRSLDPVPCVVFDPFGGSGTTGMVAAQEKRNYVMIERNPKYVEMARTTRLVPVDTGVPVKEAKAGQLPLFG